MKTQTMPEGYLQGLGHRLRIIRTFLKLDQRKMSEVMKTGQSHISKIEAGRAAPTLYQLINIKKLTEDDEYLQANLSWEWILEGKGKGILC